jgi:hypothetical protein
MMTPDDARETIKHYPEAIHFVGGPYCGSILYPKDEVITDVHRSLELKEIPDGELPTNFVPYNEFSVILHGRQGYALYIWREEWLQWTFETFVEVEGFTPLE